MEKILQVANQRKAERRIGSWVRRVEEEFPEPRQLHMQMLRGDRVWLMC